MTIINIFFQDLLELSCFHDSCCIVNDSRPPPPHREGKVKKIPDLPYCLNVFKRNVLSRLKSDFVNREPSDWLPKGFYRLPPLAVLTLPVTVSLIRQEIPPKVFSNLQTI